MLSAFDLQDYCGAAFKTKDSTSVAPTSASIAVKFYSGFATGKLCGMPKVKIKEMEAAQNLFVENFWDAKTIADFLNIQEATVGKWRKKYDWDKLRDDTINNPYKMRRLIAKQMMLIVQGDKSEIDADSLAKMYKVYEGISDKINPGIVAAIIKMQDEFMVKLNPAFAIQLLEYNKKFLVHIINSNG